MSEIHKALAVFGLEPGATKDAVQRRYKRLIMVWHPDRFANEDGKKDAEEELKKINNANDALKKHFEQDHKASGCECQRPASGASTEDRSGPGPGRKKTGETDAEAAAKRRDEERRRKAAAEEAARKAAEDQSQRQQEAVNQSLKEAEDKQNELKSNKLRWQIAAVEAALFLALCFFGWAGYGIKSWWHDVTWKWQADQEQRERDAKRQQESDTTTSTGNPYVAPYMVAPGQNNTSPYENTAPSSNNIAPPPDTAPNSNPSGFNWKPVQTTPNSNPPGFNWKPIQAAPDTNNQTINPAPFQYKPFSEQLREMNLNPPSLNTTTQTGTGNP